MRIVINIRGRLIERVECELLLRDGMNEPVCCVLIYFFNNFEAFLSYLNWARSRPVCWALVVYFVP